MNVSGHTVHKHIERPAHPVSRKYVEPILYLAERMSQHDRVVPVHGLRMVDQLAEAVQVSDVRRQPWYRQFDDQKACAQLDLETAKRCALVVLSLVLKIDTGRGDEAKAYFTEIRESLGAEPIAVPSEVDAHRELALRYLVG
jgi:hypothetical protein